MAGKAPTAAAAAKLRRRVAELEREVDALQRFPDTNPNPVLRIRDTGEVVYANPAASPLLTAWGIKVGGHLPEAWRNRVRYVLAKQQPHDYEAHFGEELYALVLAPVADLNAASLYATNITSRRRSEQKLVREAFYDALTGLANRALLRDRLERSIARSRRDTDYRFAVLFMDLDRFKPVNDSLGHSVGDQLLKEVARRITASVRDVDTVARLGGDEFVVILDGVSDIADVAGAARRALDAIKEPFVLGSEEVFISTSIGIVLADEQDASPDDLLRAADSALYQAKDLGRSRSVVFDDAMHERAITTLRLEAALRGALERKQFKLQYQPIVEVSSTQVVGFEALIRWHHPELGTIEPTDFIPIAEESDLIIPIGGWALQEACLQCARWQQQFQREPPLTVSVNLSAKQLRDRELLARVDRALRTSGLEARYLVLEITESAIIEDAAGVGETIGRLKQAGVQIHLDDFGTGYSSLSVLHEFPIDKMKIDQSFVSRLADNRDSREIVKAITNLGRSLGKPVIAEGIESAAETSELEDLECQFGQGFFFSEPLSDAGVASYLEGQLTKGAEPASAASASAAKQTAAAAPPTGDDDPAQPTDAVAAGGD